MNDTCLPTPQAIRQLNLEVFVTPSGRCLSAKTKNKTILDELIHKEYIESYHAEYGMTFSVLRDVWLGKLTAKAAMLSDPIQCQCPQNNPSEVFDYVYSHINKARAALVLWTVQTPSSTRITVTGSSNTFLEVFEHLAKAFTDTHKVLADKKAI